MCMRDMLLKLLRLPPNSPPTILPSPNLPLFALTFAKSAQVHCIGALNRSNHSLLEDLAMHFVGAPKDGTEFAKECW